MTVRGPSDRDGKICPVDLTTESICPGDDMLAAMLAQGQMANAIEDEDPKAYKKALKDVVVGIVKAEFDPDNGVTLRILDPENDFGLTTREVLELVQDCFYRPPSNLRIQVRRVRFGFLVIIYLSH